MIERHSTASNVCDDEAVARALQQALSFSPDAYDHSVAFALQEEENARGTELQENGTREIVEIDIGCSRCFIPQDEIDRQGKCRFYFILLTCPCCLLGAAHAWDEMRSRKLLLTFTMLISVLEIVVFIIMVAIFGFASPSENHLIGPPVSAFVTMGGKVTGLIVHGEVYRLVTPIFLHAGIVHLLLNMNAQITLGLGMETRWGMKVLASGYFWSGVAGNVVSSFFLPHVLSVGSSGAILGMIGMEASHMLSTWQQTDSQTRMLKSRSLLVFFAIIIIIGFFAPVDNWVHGGGFFAGLSFGLLAFRENFESEVKRRIAETFGVLYVLGVLGLFIGLFFAFH